MRRVEELLRLPVTVRGIELGRPVELLVDRGSRRLLGFDVLCGDAAHRFLPFAVASVQAGEIEVETPLVLLDFGQLDFYREQATTLRNLEGEAAGLYVRRDGTLEPADATDPR
ncbi:MAG TPA: hypothetical protein VF002_08345 [Gaiellaceae bacterium]